MMDFEKESELIIGSAFKVIMRWASVMSSLSTNAVC
jgi:hypothetical protein